VNIGAHVMFHISLTYSMVAYKKFTKVTCVHSTGINTKLVKW